MHKLSSTILLFCLLTYPSLQAQIFESKQFYASGTVIDDSTKKSIGLVHIFNESKRTGSIATEEGKFTFRADVGDTIVFSALGYLYKVMLVNETMLNEGANVFLTPRIYEIESVDIVAFRSYEDFKRKFLALELPETKTDILRQNLIVIGRKEALEAIEERKVQDALNGQPGKEPMNGFTLLYKEDLQRMNYARVLKQEKKQRVIDKKYNYEIVLKVTQLPKDEVIDFIGFCNFSTEFLYRATEYEILVKIEEKLKEYLDKKKQGRLLKEDIDRIHYT